jgi:hypothetical protein
MDTKSDVQSQLKIIKETLASKVEFAVQKLDEQ